MRLDIPPIAGLGILAIAALVLTAPTDAAGPVTETPVSLGDHAHAGATVLEGAFTPGPDARAIVEEAIFREGTRPVIARFSLYSAVPALPDNENGNDNGAMRAGLGLKIKAANGDDFDIQASQHLNVATHPRAKEFPEDDRAYPVSYAQTKYFGVHPVKLTNDKGLSVTVHYQFVPRAEERYLTADERRTMSESYLHDEIVKRIAATPVMFDWYAQIAAQGDIKGEVVHDPSVVRPDSRERVLLGTFTLIDTPTTQSPTGSPGR